jgi:acyl carrier protein
VLTSETSDQVETIVIGKISAIISERGGDVVPISRSAKLNANLALSSLDLALLVSELEFETGVDPFAELVSITSVRTVDDLVKAYRRAMLPEAERTEADDGLADAQRRAEKRRLRTTGQ